MPRESHCRKGIGGEEIAGHELHFPHAAIAAHHIAKRHVKFGALAPFLDLRLDRQLLELGDGFGEGDAARAADAGTGSRCCTATSSCCASPRLPGPAAPSATSGAG